MPRISQSIAMGVGVAGAMVDVTSYADIDAGVEYSHGRHGEFDDTPPGSFSFTLDNADGRFTPDNSSSALSTTVVEGMRVCWKLGSRLVEGTVRSIQPVFPGAQSAWAQVRITCDDMLGEAGRQELPEFPDAMVDAATRFLSWPMDDASGSVSAAEASGISDLSAYNFNYTTSVESGGWVNGSAFGALPQMANLWRRMFLCGTSDSSDFLDASITGTDFGYGTAGMGFWGFWATTTGGSNGGVRIQFQGTDSYISFQLSATTFFVTHSHNGSSTAASTAVSGAALNYFSIGVTTSYSAGSWFRQITVYVNGVSAYAPTSLNVGSSLTNAQRQPVRVRVSGIGTSSAASPTYFAHITHTLEQVHEETLATQTLTGMVATLRYVAPSITIDTVPPGFSTAPATFSDGASSALTRLNEIAATEQGHLYAETTGTLTASTQVIKLRERDRPEAVSASFDAELELQGNPLFVRDIADMVSAVRVYSLTGNTNVTDPTLTARVGSSNASETINYTTEIDRIMWGQDRLQRGANVQLRVASIDIDAMTTPTDRSSDLLGLIEGDRVRITNLPSTQLGFSTWDGWVLGADETHTLETHTFTLHLMTVLPSPAVFDTDRFTADGILTLSASINSAVTSLSVATAGSTLSTSETPYTIIIGTEKMTVTACSGATPQVLTVTRGAGGTTAASHTAGDAVEISPSALLAF